jgi:dipeptidyl aminopeptidase/acylaminoacyl peptidase
MPTIRRIAIATLIACTAFLGFAEGAGELIPREVFFGNPERASVKISPNGDRLSFLAADQGVLNVWVQTIGADDARPVTSATGRPIRSYFWATNGDQIIYAQDRGGDENFRLFAVDVDTGEEVELTPFDGVQARVTAIDRQFPDELLVAVNNRNPQLHDIWRVNTRTGDGEMVFQNDRGFISLQADSDFGVRLASRMDPATGRIDVYARDTADGDWYELVRFGMEDNQTSQAVGFSRDGTVIYVVDSRNSNTGELFAYDTAGADGPTYDRIAGDPRSDVADLIVDPETGRPQAVAFEYARREWQILDPRLRKDFDVLGRVADGEMSITSRDLADNHWVVAFVRDDGPVTYYLYDRRAKHARYLFSNRPALEGLTLARMRPVIITARDGKQLVSYLTVPVSAVEPTPLPAGAPVAEDRPEPAVEPEELIDVDDLIDPDDLGGARFAMIADDDEEKKPAKKGPRHNKFRKSKKKTAPAEPKAPKAEPTTEPESETPAKTPAAAPVPTQPAGKPRPTAVEAEAPTTEPEMEPFEAPLPAERPKVIKIEPKAPERIDVTPLEPIRPTMRPVTARPGPPWPMVLLVHGGPWARDTWGYNALHQWLANRGYAVLSVNFRGSTGFGKEFLNAGNREWAGRMHDDLIDAVNWAVAEGIADPDRVAIMGGSYGGYATLVGLTFTPDFFAAGVDIVGPSHVRTLLESIPPYWKPVQALFDGRVGRLDEPEYLDQISPLTRVDEIRRPLLIGQGANDPRVKEAESKQIVDAMQGKGLPVTYVVFPDEGHGFARPANSLAFFAVTEAFLAQHLGGRFEPIESAVRSSSADVQAGANLVPGLAEGVQ